MALNRCVSCGAFVVRSKCPSCGGRLARVTKLGALATLMGSSAFAMTLMACYGCPDGSCGGGDYYPDADTDARTLAHPELGDDAGADADADTADANHLDAGDASDAHDAGDADAH